jgi:hypothetical protein
LHRALLAFVFHRVRPGAVSFSVRRKRLDFINGGHQFALDMDAQTSAERLSEIAEILALGLQRLRARKSSPLSGDRGESSLHSGADRSGHANSFSKELDA